MGDNADLKARIAAVAGKINQHKQNQGQPFALKPQHHDAHRNVPSQRSPNGRWSPFGSRGRAGQPLPHKNRTLVLGGNQASPPRGPEITPATEALANPDFAAKTFVTTQAPGRKVLMNKDTYAREQKQVLEQQETARAAKRQKVDLQQRTTLMNHVNTTSASGNREMVVEGIRFQLREDGAKLIRVSGKTRSHCSPSRNSQLSRVDPSTIAKKIPKKLRIANVDFHRTKNGNFVRAHAVRELIRYPPHAKLASYDRDLLLDHRRPTIRKEKPQCEQFTKHGTEFPLLLTLHGQKLNAICGKSPCSQLTSV